LFTKVGIGFPQEINGKRGHSFLSRIIKVLQRALKEGLRRPLEAGTEFEPRNSLLEGLTKGRLIISGKTLKNQRNWPP